MLKLISYSFLFGIFIHVFGSLMLKRSVNNIDLMKLVSSTSNVVENPSKNVVSMAEVNSLQKIRPGVL